jgi:hypothetical protein
VDHQTGGHSAAIPLHTGISIPTPTPVGLFGRQQNNAPLGRPAVPFKTLGTLSKPWVPPPTLRTAARLANSVLPAGGGGARPSGVPLRRLPGSKARTGCGGDRAWSLYHWGDSQAARRPTDDARQHARSLLLDVRSTAQGLIPIAATGVLDCRYPAKIKGVFGDVELTHCRATKLCFREKSRCVVLHEFKQPIATTHPFFVGSFREFLLSGLTAHDPLSSLSLAMRSCAWSGLRIRYSNSPSCSGNSIVTRYVLSRRIDRPNDRMKLHAVTDRKLVGHCLSASNKKAPAAGGARPMPRSRSSKC